MVVTPPDTPVSRPLDGSMLPIVVSTLVHVPPDGVALNEEMVPMHILDELIIGVGKGFTVTVAVVYTVPQGSVTV